MDFFKQIGNRLKLRLQALTPGQRLVAAALGGGGLLALILLFVLSSPGDYAVLFSNLSQEDAGAIVSRLKGKKVPYRLEAGGATITVPRSEVYELRLQLAGEGIPRGGGVGFELFDRQNLGATDFVQRLNYQRALQGELARTIAGIPEVAEARVHIVTPKESLFLDDQKQATASVALKLRPGRTLSASQVDGIVHLVASAVSGLHPSQVTVVDLTGRILSKPQDTATAAGLSSAQITLQRQVEEGLERKVQTLFDQMVGPRKSFVRVSADLDFQKIDIREETFTPNRELVRSEQKTLERTTTGAEGGGNPESRFELGRGTVAAPPPGKGPPPLTAPATPKAGGEKSGSERQVELKNYEINRVLRQVVEQPGKLKRVSLAVVVDGLYKGKANTFTARSPEEMRQFANLAKKAVGFNAERGDQLELSCAPLAALTPEGTVAAGAVGGWQDNLWYTAKIGLVVLVILAVLGLLLKKRRTPVQPPLLEGPRGAVLPPPPVREAALPAQRGGPLPSPSPPPLALPDAVDGQGKVSHLVTAYPERAVEVLRLWLHENEAK
ncbi:MAG: flagellar M-ring protein FliF [Deltaproteobacteria bacterium]|nr:flagellar M-ring protein FliF [Deltaproteobacteria bacterium]